MDTMQFRDYLFAHNPHTISVTQKNHLPVHFCPGKGEVVQQMGAGGRVVVCRGNFFGATYAQAVAQLAAFREAAGRDGPGMLYLPGIPPFGAQLRELYFQAEGDGRIIPYTMEFVEAE